MYESEPGDRIYLVTAGRLTVCFELPRASVERLAEVAPARTLAGRVASPLSELARRDP